MDQSRDSQLFSSGFEVASFVTSSDLLRRSWDVITSSHANIVSNIGDELTWKVYREQNTNVTIIAFEATLPDSSNPQPDFLSLNSFAVSLFIKNHKKFEPEIFNYKNNRIPLIITGHGLGGAVASQFTISLLEPKSSAKNRPLCITFGSPLVGSKILQKAISDSSIWNSSFLHVVSHKDPLPRLFIENATSSYTPFGTFLLSSDESSTCFENPVSLLEILNAFRANHVQNQGFQSNDYGNIVENLNLKVICKDFTTPPEDKTHSDSFETGISLQLQALGITDSQTSGTRMQLGTLELTPQLQQLQQNNIDVNVLKPKIKTLEKNFMFKKSGVSFDPFKKLNHLKLYMMQLEWYKKVTKEQQIGYYDSYKNRNSIRDYDVSVFHRKLSIYWENMIEEADMKTAEERMAIQIRLLYGGTSYRRMVEPLAIAQYYIEGGKDYINRKRSNHFKKLEQWWIEGTTNATSSLNITSRRNVEALLTIDSCFWAHVEEALISCKQLNDANSSLSEKEEAIRKLLEFENYVYGQLMNYAVTPEIFLSGSSYMRWWYQYKKIKGSSYSSALANLMRNADNYNVEYVGGTYNFTEN